MCFFLLSLDDFVDRISLLSSETQRCSHSGQSSCKSFLFAKLSSSSLDLKILNPPLFVFFVFALPFLQICFNFAPNWFNAIRLLTFQLRKCFPSMIFSFWVILIDFLATRNANLFLDLRSFYIFFGVGFLGVRTCSKVVILSAPIWGCFLFAFACCICLVGGPGYNIVFFCWLLLLRKLVKAVELWFW